MHQPRKTRKFRDNSEPRYGTPRKGRDSFEESSSAQRETSTESKLTVKLPNSLIREIKILSIKKNHTIKETCKEALKDYIAKYSDRVI